MPWFDGIAATAPGTLVDAGGGAKAFLPHPLRSGLQLSPAIHRLVAETRAELGKLWGIGRLLRNPVLFVRPLQAREAAASSRIEGTKTSNEEALANEAAGVDSNTDPDGKEVQNYLRALEHGVQALQRGRSLNQGLVLELHRILLEGVRGQDTTPGRYRDAQVFLGTNRLDTARFVPPPALHVPSCMEDLQRFLDQKGPDDPLVRVALAHYQFEAIHPFADGNGRVGRLLIALQMIAEGLQHQPLLYVSSRLEQSRQSYYDHLLEVSLRSAQAEWVEFFVGAVLASARETGDKLHRLLAILDTFRERVRTAPTPGPARLLELIEAWPFFTVAAAQKHLGVDAPATAKAAIDVLVKAGIVAEYAQKARGTRGRPARIYWCEPLVQVLSG
jgi:Fic family protein